MSGYLPDGVTDAHPHFNPAPISASAVECGADEALVVPSFAVKVVAQRIRDELDLLSKHGWAISNKDARGLVERLDQLIAQVEGLEQEREYECPFHDDVDLPESECAQWVCPVCGNDRETDTLPEERDPDEEWERRNER